ncbi:Carbonyl reductase [NADPH] 3 [Smittium mucronatum]|uniref:Carbonyl reductase [NADPH] 3 n=1 Tax=Smittium mucronatum TaxID=133383 RepID=A0A1R0H975_9FUNG|nr:Carbonyl reductase [NADPH] 3 [Smittium mucronatum]
MNRLAVITGSNKGIGYELARSLYLKSASPINVYMTSRNESLGLQAVHRLSEERDKVPNPESKLSYHQLDITDPKSISVFKDHLKSKHGTSSIDLLVNNAGIMPKDQDLETAKTTIQTNYFGTVSMTSSLLELMNVKGRVVFISSTLGKLSYHSPQIQKRFLAPDLSLSELDKIELDFIQAATENVLDKAGFNESPYTTSKSGVTMYARILARDYAADPRKLFFGSCCPGWVKTELGGPKAILSLQQGVKTPLYLINGEYDSLYKNNGKFFYQSRVVNY